MAEPEDEDKMKQFFNRSSSKKKKLLQQQHSDPALPHGNGHGPAAGGSVKDNNNDPGDPQMRCGERKKNKQLFRKGFFKRLKRGNKKRENGKNQNTRKPSLVANEKVIRQLDDLKHEFEEAVSSPVVPSSTKATNVHDSQMGKNALSQSLISGEIKESDKNPPSDGEKMLAKEPVVNPEVKAESNGSNFEAKVLEREPIHSSLRPVQIRRPKSRRLSGTYPMSLSQQMNHRSSSFPTGGISSSAPPRAASNLVAVEGRDIEQDYELVKYLPVDKLPRGGMSIKTEAVGRVQFGIPPETIKDSMCLGIEVPTVYIVPMERFCRVVGHALGVNLAEFEFPAYYNFFIRQKRVQLIVDSKEAETNIRRVFGETLLGPSQFRGDDAIEFREEDFAATYDRAMIPNFEKELKHFRTMPNGKELDLDTLLQFIHFSIVAGNNIKTKLGMPPPQPEEQEEVEKTDTSNDNGKSFGSMLMDAMKNDSEEDESDEGISENGSENISNTDKSAQNSTTHKSWPLMNALNSYSVAIVYPPNVSDEDKISGKCKRVEIFKGSEEDDNYILHDIDENNHIIGKAIFSDTDITVSDSVSLAGFNDDAEENPDFDPQKISIPPTFYPPSFGVTVLGNSHGFDKEGSTSGYVLWVNGRGIMIDPPPYSSATLEREGIRPRTIVAIILTHCHADHDAGAFQKVLTGSPVVVITTPTIYKSFIRKYAALSSLSKKLLMHSHRFKAAIIGESIKFQGANFNFFYTLHTIPCIGFRVDWRERSMVFTGDHYNSPEGIDALAAKGVMSKERAEDLKHMPYQDTDLLLHEAGVPPIHTPIDVLQKLPTKIKKRLYIVHTSKSTIPEGSDLKVAPTGTRGTIRLDDKKPVGRKISLLGSLQERDESDPDSFSNFNSLDYDLNEETTSLRNSTYYSSNHNSLKNIRKFGTKNSLSASTVAMSSDAPLVALRPASSTDAWFILNLLSSVPFFTSLSFVATMSVLETARVDAFSTNKIVVTAERRADVLCVIWEGTCIERPTSSALRRRDVEGRDYEDLNTESANRRMSVISADHGVHEPLSEKDFTAKRKPAIWHAGDWTGPRSLQPDKRLSGENSRSSHHDIVAMSKEGAKVITIEFSALHKILSEGSSLYRKYLARKSARKKKSSPSSDGLATPALMKKDTVKRLHVMELLDCSSALRKLTAVQKRHLESLAEGPIYYHPSERLWKAGARVENAFIVVEGTATFVSKRRNSSTCSMNEQPVHKHWSQSSKGGYGLGQSILEDTLNMSLSAAKVRSEFGDDEDSSSIDSDSSLSTNQSEAQANSASITFDRSLGGFNDYRTGAASNLSNRSSSSHRDSVSSCSMSLPIDSNDGSNDGILAVTGGGNITGLNALDDERRAKLQQNRRRSSKDRFHNKILGRLHSRRIFTTGKNVFVRGNFLGDVSKMVAGFHSPQNEFGKTLENDDEESFEFGYGDKAEGIDTMIIHEQEGDKGMLHNSTLAAGEEGCVVLVFKRDSLKPFLDEYPGVLLSLLGTQAVL